MVVSVADEGRGVSTDQLQDLFRKYFRIEGGDGDRGSAGSGPGLVICKGHMEEESEPRVMALALDQAHALASPSRWPNRHPG